MMSSGLNFALIFSNESGLERLSILLRAEFEQLAMSPLCLLEVFHDCTSTEIFAGFVKIYHPY